MRLIFPGMQERAWLKRWQNNSAHVSDQFIEHGVAKANGTLDTISTRVTGTALLESRTKWKFESRTQIVFIPLEEMSRFMPRTF